MFKNIYFLIFLISAFLISEKAQARLIAEPPLFTVNTAPYSAKPKTKTKTTTVKKNTVRNMRLGMMGNDVLVLQNFLIKKNTGPAARALAAHKATGRFGDLTAEALKEFQRANKLAVDGVAGPRVRALYNK
jgi:peptidoglycan hydrolase-like protein with peptidoglycan-binding domain